MNRLRFALCLLGCLVLSGCLDVDNEWTLNPDGSGKVRHRVVHNPSSFLGSAFGGSKTPRAFARELLEKSEGIEAWSDLSYSKNGEGHLLFEGVAYFKDASAVRLQHEVVKTRFRQEAGQLVVSFAGTDKEALDLGPLTGSKGGSGLGNASTTSGFRMSLRLLRMQLGSMKAFLKGRDRIRLPGAIAPGHAGVLKEGVLEVRFSFERLTQFLDRVEADPKLLEVMRARSRKSSSGVDSLDPAKEKEFDGLATTFMVGGAAREARSGGGKPVFDYVDEVKAAKERSAKAYDAVGYALPGRPGKALRALELGGIEYVHEESADSNDFEYQGDFEPHLHFHFGGTLGEKPLKLLGGRLTRVIATDGTSLLLDAKTRELKGVRRPGSLDFTFGAIARLTSSCAGGYEEVSGYVEYLLPSGRTEDVDLGLVGYTKGAKGTRYEAEIKDVDARSLSLKLSGVDESEIAKITLLDAAGQEVPAQEGGSWSSGSEMNLTYRLPRGAAWPARGKVVLTRHRGRTRHRVPFKLTELNAEGVNRGN